MDKCHIRQNVKYLSDLISKNFCKQEIWYELQNQKIEHLLKMKYDITPEACRVCLRKNSSCRSIFSPLDETDLAPIAKLKLVSGVNVSPEDEKNSIRLPKSICKTCEISLNMAFSLRNRARKSDQILNVYCNRLNKDSIIVELDNGRKFKLSKELTLKVIRKNEQPVPLTSANLQTNTYDIEDDDEECQEEDDDDSLSQDVAYDILNENEEFIHNVEDPLQEEMEKLKSETTPVENNVNNPKKYTNEDDPHVKENEHEKEKKDEEQIKVPQTYNVQEIAQRLQSSDKYELVSWKQDGDPNAVPVFKLRLKDYVEEKNSNFFICEICGNTYHQRHRLKEHMRRHNKEKTYACEICGKSFAISEGLRRHVLTHGAQKPFKCNFCTRRFYTPSARKAHEKVHSGAKPYVCKVCKRGFAYTCSLRKHMLIHENRKLYRCDYCDKEFRLQHHLKQHEETQIHKDAVAEQGNPQSKTELFPPEF